MLALRLLWRDWRGGELGILVAALVMAVTIVTGVALFTERLQQGIQAQSARFLAADRVLQSPRPVDPAWLRQARSLGLQSAEEISFRSMVYAADRAGSAMQLASVKAVSAHYPLRGHLQVADRAFGAAVDSDSGPRAGEVWVESRLLPLLGIAVGDALYVGDAKLRVTRVLVSEPDRGASLIELGPRVMMSTADIAATHIIQPGSRVRYRYLFAGDTRALSRFSRWLHPRLQPSHRWLDLQEDQPRLYSSIRRAGQFLMLAGAIGVALAGIAIARAAHRFSERHYDYVAMMKALGVTGRRIVRLYIVHLLALAVLGIVVGCGAGWLIQGVFLGSLRDILNLQTLPALTVRPFAIGAATALVCLFGFALPSLVSLGGVSPLRVLRRDLRPFETGLLTSSLAGIAGIALLMWWYTGDPGLTLAMMAGVGGTLVLIGALVWLLLRGTRPLGMQANSTWRLALASLRRRGAASAAQTVIFSLSIMLFLVLALVQSSLINDWKTRLPAGTPNLFLINISKPQLGAVRQWLRDHRLHAEPLYPIVKGRLLSVDGDPVRERLRAHDKSVNVDSLNRELNLTWSKTPPGGNTLVAGHWWRPDSAVHEVSIEAGLARRLGAGIGDRLQFALGSERLNVTISSIRSLDWDSMKPNFYMILPPGLLDHYPATYITSFYLPPGAKSSLNQLLHHFPTITVIEMDQVIAQIRSIIRQVSVAIAWVLGLIVVSALLVLLASVQASLDTRYRESALLRALGARRRLVMGSLVLEFCILGAAAGILAAFSAEVAVYGLQKEVLRMAYVSHPWVWLVGPILGAVLVGGAGYAGCRKTVNAPPARVLQVLQ